MEKVSGTEKEKNALKGQVRFLRAYYYLKLVLIYGQPYNGKNANPDTALGVPLKHSYISDRPYVDWNIIRYYLHAKGIL